MSFNIPYPSDKVSSLPHNFDQVLYYSLEASFSTIEVIMWRFCRIVRLGKIKKINKYLFNKCDSGNP